MRFHRRVGPTAHSIGKRVPEEVTQGTPTFDSSGQAVNTNASRTGDYAKNTVASSTPPSTIALAVLLAVAIVAFISGCVFWRIKRRSQRSGGSQPVSSSPHSTLFGMESRVESVESDSSSFGVRSIRVEKPEKAFVLNPPFRNEETGWAPQVRDYRGVPLVNGELPRHVQAAKEGKRWLRSLSQVGLNEPKAETPPPTYTVANGHHPSKSADIRAGIPLPVTPPETITVQPPTPPTPTNGKKPKFSPPPLSKPTKQPMMPSSRFSLSPLPKTPGAEPLPSPARNTSFMHQQEELTSAKTPAEIKIGTGKDGLPLPRLMSVIHTFTPSLEDEMLIHIGDTIRIIEEYTDGWCLVQRVEKSDAPRGVVPRFCLVERQPKQSTRRNIIKSIQASAKRM